MSIFTPKDPVITYQFMEYMHYAVKNNQEATLLEALQYACEQTEKSDEELIVIAERLAKEKQQEESGTKQPARKEKTFGTQFMEWYSGLNPDELCMMASGYDYEKARQLYCVLDKSITDKILKSYAERVWQEAYLRYEASLFGFGGGYGKGGKQANEKVVDIGEMDANDLNALMSRR